MCVRACVRNKISKRRKRTRVSGVAEWSCCDGVHEMTQVLLACDDDDQCQLTCQWVDRQDDVGSSGETVHKNSFITRQINWRLTTLLTHRGHWTTQRVSARIFYYVPHFALPRCAMSLTAIRYQKLYRSGMWTLGVELINLQYQAGLCERRRHLAAVSRCGRDPLMHAILQVTHTIRCADTCHRTLDEQ